MTTLTERRALIVPAPLREWANDVAHVLDPDEGGAFSFTAGLSADGSEPPTHYLCSVPLAPQTAAMLDSTDAAPAHAALQQLASARGRYYSLSMEGLQELRDAMVVSVLPWREAIVMLALKPVMPEEAWRESS